jgi:uncharacterized Zn finger protein
MRDNRAVAQIEVTEESVRGLVDGGVYEEGLLLMGSVSGLSVAGTVVGAAVDGIPVRARIRDGWLDGECEQCAGLSRCPHMVAALLAWVRSGPPDDDDVALLRAEFDGALAEEELDGEYLDELVDDLEDLIEEEPAAVRDLADRVMNEIEARNAAHLADLLERIEDLWLEARQVAGPPGRLVAGFGVRRADR